jgi:type IV pilus assembly protein PilA
MVRNAKKGFTLIELLIVVVIIGILAAIAIPKFANTKEKAYYAAMKSDLRNLVTAQEAYFSERGNVYANDITQLGTNYKASTGVTVVLSGAGTGTSWGATAAHSALGSRTCGIAVGQGATSEGEPICP